MNSVKKQVRLDVHHQVENQVWEQVDNHDQRLVWKHVHIGNQVYREVYYEVCYQPQ